MIGSSARHVPAPVIQRSDLARRFARGACAERERWGSARRQLPTAPKRDSVMVSHAAETAAFDRKAVHFRDGLIERGAELPRPPGGSVRS